jgi:sterol desaturase/sphingolipid hydroxylase (fatty acid hydroxylase superfamily)
MATQIILFATPIFFLLIFIELWASVKAKSKVFRFNDAITSLSLGIISQTQKLMVFTFAAIVYAWLEKTLALGRLSADSILTWLFAFVFYDFLYYWYHRFSHQINFLWAAHVVHHQSEEYNLTTALRQTSSSVGAWMFYIPSFVIGIPAEVFFVSGALNLVYQFWVHTQLIGKLGWFETIFVTPSHHRVHHGQNQIYIDKNHGGVFIIWDRLFGTFQEELDSEKVIYGVRRAVKSFNPLWANIHTWWSLISDAWRTESWKDKFRIWFMPTGWRPEDVSEKFPIKKVNPNELVKYDPPSSLWLKVYVLIQFSVALVAAVLFILMSNSLESWQTWIVWVGITIPVVTAGLLMESNSNAVKLEFIRLIASMLLISFYLYDGSSYIQYSLSSYCMLSIVALFFIKTGITQSQKLVKQQPDAS